MDDLISRQAAIDAFYLQADDDGWWTGTAQDMEELLKALPSAQTEIIRCKECKHGMYDVMCHFYWCHGRAHSGGWFCADAERRTDE